MIRVRIKKYYVYNFSTKTYVVGTHWDGCFKHPNRMLRMMGNIQFTNLRSNFCLARPMVLKTFDCFRFYFIIS